jgi:protein-disulfide isomerase
MITRALLVAVAALALADARGTRQTLDPLAARSKGRRDAPITLYEMSDFQCPYCRAFALGTMPPLEREYITTGKVRLVYINLPLTSVHPNAEAAARVAVCAGRQDRFWAMHDLLFRHQDEWAKLPKPEAFLLALGDSARLDRTALAACVAAKETAAEVDADAARARRAGAVSTPTFYVEGGLLEGAAPVAVFRTVLDSIYRAKTGR